METTEQHVNWVEVWRNAADYRLELAKSKEPAFNLFLAGMYFDCANMRQTARACRIASKESEV